ncbi:hypothetical protein ACXJJ3_11390 [Kribbella sp. WER1]
MGGSGDVLVVTAMPLSANARVELSELLGEGYVVVDIRTAPSTANILLTPVVSGQLLGNLRHMFPQARILFTELHDDGHGISFPGPLARIMANGPDGYYVAHALDALAPAIQTETRLQLSGSSRKNGPRFALPAPAAPAAPAEDPPDLDGSTVIWVDRTQHSTPPAGRWLDPEPIDSVVGELLGIPNPRDDTLWATLTAECAIRLLTATGENVLVDVGSLTPTVAAELKIRVSSEGIDHSSWPS